MKVAALRAADLKADAADPRVVPEFPEAECQAPERPAAVAVSMAADLREAEADFTAVEAERLVEAEVSMAAVGLQAVAAVALVTVAHIGNERKTWLRMFPLREGKGLGAPGSPDVSSFPCDLRDLCVKLIREINPIAMPPKMPYFCKRHLDANRYCIHESDSFLSK
jgi:hypothetical protein